MNQSLKTRILLARRVDFQGKTDDPIRMQTRAFQVCVESDAPAADEALGAQMAKDLANRLEKPVIAISARTGMGLAKLASEATLHR